MRCRLAGSPWSPNAAGTRADTLEAIALPPTPPTDAELDVLIRARLAAVGIDIDQLPPGRQPDPVTGSPGRDAVLASLRAFLRGTVATLSGYQLPVPPGTDPEDVKPLSQQRAPMLYPSISTAWRAS